MQGHPDAATHVAEVRGALTGLDVGVRDVEHAEGRSGSVSLHIVMDDGWQPLDGSWGPEDSAAAMFNAMESHGYRHVPGTSRFSPDGFTRFVKDGMAFDFDPPALGDWGVTTPIAD